MIMNSKFLVFTQLLFVYCLSYTRNITSLITDNLIHTYIIESVFCKPVITKERRNEFRKIGREVAQNEETDKGYFLSRSTHFP